MPFLIVVDIEYNRETLRQVKITSDPDGPQEHNNVVFDPLYNDQNTRVVALTLHVRSHLSSLALVLKQKGIELLEEPNQYEHAIASLLRVLLRLTTRDVWDIMIAKLFVQSPGQPTYACAFPLFVDKSPSKGLSVAILVLLTKQCSDYHWRSVQHRRQWLWKRPIWLSSGWRWGQLG